MELIWWFVAFQLFPFLAVCKGKQEDACRLINIVYQMKKDSPEFFSNRDVLSMEVQSSLTNQHFVILPTTPDNHNLILFRLSSYEPRDYDFDHTAKTFIMTFGEFKGFK